VPHATTVKRYVNLAYYQKKDWKRFLESIDDYEIDSAIKKSENKKGRRHIDEMDPTKIAGFFDDDGY